MAVGVLGFIGLTEEYSKAVGYSRNLGRGGVMKQGSTCSAQRAPMHPTPSIYIYIYTRNLASLLINLMYSASTRLRA